MAEEANGGRISVSRSDLRADLAELELRLRTYLDQALALKANAVTMAELVKRVDLHEAGVFPPAWELKMTSLIDNSINARITDTWALRSSKAIYAYTFIGLSALVISAVDLFARFHH